MKQIKLMLLMSSTLLFACAKLTIVHELDERDANEIMVLLDQNQISSDKEPDGEATNKGMKFRIDVGASEANRAWKILTDNQLPRKKDTGYGEVFSSSGLIPTASEEKAKMLQAITGELSRTLKSIDGILDARVHVVMPEESSLSVKEEDKAHATASVWIKYVPGRLDRTVTDIEIQQLVANSIEKLDFKNVKVVRTAAASADAGAIGNLTAGALVEIMKIHMSPTDVNKFRLIIGMAVLLIVLLAIALIFVILRKNNTPSAGTSGPPTAATGG